MSALRFAAIAAVVTLAGCGDVKQSVSTPPVKRPSEVSSYTAAQLQSARSLARTCPERHGWRCGVVLASVKASGWTAVVVRDDGVVTTLTAGFDGPGGYIDEDVGVAQYPPGVMVRWSTAGDDNVVSVDEIAVIG
jgi:hypothetical protein